MNIIFFGSNIDIIEEWKDKHDIKNSLLSYDRSSLNELLKINSSAIVISDYDSVAHDINALISSNNLPDKLIVLERSPELTTGKMLITNGVKAYGNSRMLKIHFDQMIQTVQNSKIWTYPNLTSALITTNTDSSLDKNSIDLIEHRLSSKEKEVIYLLLKGFTNNAISDSLDIKVRTVKAHISSIFAKLHVNDRLSLILLLK